MVGKTMHRASPIAVTVNSTAIKRATINATRSAKTKMAMEKQMIRMRGPPVRATLNRRKAFDCKHASR